MQTLFSYCSNVHDHHHTVMRDSFKHLRVLSNSYIFLARGIESKHESNRIFSSIFISLACDGTHKTSTENTYSNYKRLKNMLWMQIKYLKSRKNVSCLSTQEPDMVFSNLVFRNDIKAKLLCNRIRCWRFWMVEQLILNSCKAFYRMLPAYVFRKCPSI